MGRNFYEARVIGAGWLRCVGTGRVAGALCPPPAVTAGCPYHASFQPLLPLTHLHAPHQCLQILGVKKDATEDDLKKVPGVPDSARQSCRYCRGPVRLVKLLLPSRPMCCRPPPYCRHIASWRSSGTLTATGTRWRRPPKSSRRQGQGAGVAGWQEAG